MVSVQTETGTAASVPDTVRKQEWEREVDALVVGSGAGGLLAALVAARHGARTLVIEKSSEYGGTSATSGGGIWIPNSPLAPAEHQDSPEDAFTYIRALSADFVPDERIHAYVRNAPQMLGWVNANTSVRYVSLPYIDYHAEVPGGKLGYRTHLPLPMDGRLLEDDVRDLRATSPAASLFGKINWDIGETFALLFRPKGWMRTAAGMVGRYYLDLPHRLRSTKDRHLTLGTALVGGLRLALKQADVPLWLNTALEELVVRDGRVVGAVVRQNGSAVRIRVRRGVILAAGGYERNARWRALYLPQVPDPTHSGSQENNTGEAITIAQQAGAAVSHMNLAWWAPVFRIPGENRGRLCTIERALPGCIMVNQAGKRYLNEAASYHVVGHQMAEADAPGAGTIPSWLVFDATFRKKYPVGPLLPMIPDGAHSRAIRSVLRKSNTVEGLARAIKVPEAALRETLSRFNAHAAEGKDPDFGRGEAAYDRMFGDARVQPNPCLAPILKAPFYAMPIYPGDIGTCGGLATDAEARVLNAQGQPVPGLYAVGNVATSVMGGSYPGAGSTLGPAMTFGFVAARHLAGANEPA